MHKLTICINKGGQIDWLPNVGNPKNINVDDWILEIDKTITTGKGKKEIIKDYLLSRFICYLIVQNADSRKPVIAFAQQYFAIRTRQDELNQKIGKLLQRSRKDFI